MKTNTILACAALGLLCLSAPAVSKAQWVISGGMGNGPDNLQSGTGLAFTDSSCGAFAAAKYDGPAQSKSITVTFTAKLIWMGMGPPAVAAKVQASVQVSGTTQYLGPQGQSYADSTAQTKLPKANTSGNSGNGAHYNQGPPATNGNLFAQRLSGSINANAQYNNPAIPQGSQGAVSFAEADGAIFFAITP